MSIEEISICHLKLRIDKKSLRILNLKLWIEENIIKIKVKLQINQFLKIDRLNSKAKIYTLQNDRRRN
ncbi:unnamed protein product [marine sediment metagenome]|uniref:Uncharacterized protein n=1 Tax=marine sediment metagenome TaxID=412755 RepID=X1BJW9_9ZZZZ